MAERRALPTIVSETNERIEQLARKMWAAYVRAQTTDERSSYTPWDKLTDHETQRGFRAVARMVLRDAAKSTAFTIRCKK